MELNILKGTYVVAVSGGVDSVALLHMLHAQCFAPNYTFIVAHYDHGIRTDSDKDERLVATLANDYGMAYEKGEGHLGPNASEDVARTKRYEFLRKIMKKYKATAIITAHHQDDLLETILLHVQRGTGRHGLSPMSRTADIVRPLLSYAKSDIVAYAKQHALSWNEDSTNSDTKYARNKLRHMLAKNLTEAKRGQLQGLYKDMLSANNESDMLTASIVSVVTNKQNEIVRSRFVTLPFSVACECVKFWLKTEGITAVDKQLITRCAVAIKTLQIGKKLDCSSGRFLVSQKTSVKIM